MNTADIRIQDPAGLNVVPTYQWQTKAANTPINPGEFVKVDLTHAIPYVTIIADADGTSGSNLVGLCKSKDTVVTATDGVVDVYMPLPGIIYSAKAKSSTLANTAALILALIGKRVIFDVTSSVFTVDTGATDDKNNALRIVGGNYATYEIYFTIAPSSTWLAGTTI